MTSEAQSASATNETVTVKVYDLWAIGDKTWEDIEPETYEVPVSEGYGVPAEDSDARVTLAEDVQTHTRFGFDIAEEDLERFEEVTLNIHGNDSDHTPEEWGRPVERGVPFHEDGPEGPFITEIWGRIIMYVAEVEEADDEEESTDD